MYNNSNIHWDPSWTHLYGPAQRTN